MHKFSNYLTSCLIAGVAICGGPSPMPAHAQVAPAAITAGAAVNHMVDNLRNALLDIIAKLEQTVSSGTFLARMQANNLLAELDHHASAVMGKTFEQLTEQQQRFFRGAQQTVAEVQAMNERMADNLDRIAQRFEAAVANAPFGQAEPRMQQASPRVLTLSQAAGLVRLTFDGSWLAHGTPSLKIGDTACRLTDLADPRVTFECPAKAFEGPAGAAVRYVTGTFTARQKPGWGERLLPAFLTTTPKVKAYPVSVGVVRNDFARVKVSAVVVQEVEETRQRRMDYDTGARHCVWGSDTLVNISPAGPEWTIDVTSIGLVLSSGGRSELRNVTPKGFQVYAVGHNRGKCGPFGIKDARGWANGHVVWTERRTVSRPENRHVFEDLLVWGGARVIPLPEKVRNYVVAVTFFDARTREYNAALRDERLRLEQDDQSRSLRITPLAMSEVFR